MGIIRSGELRDRITIQGASSAPQPGGGKVKTWTDVGLPIWAKIEPLSGGEAFAQGIARNTQFYRVTIRYRSDVTPANRIMWGGVALNIRTAGDPDPRGEALVMTAESGAGEP